MSRKTAFLSLTSFVILAAACSKSHDKASSTVATGTWNLTSIKVAASTSLTEVDTTSGENDSTIAVANYTMTDVTGTFQFGTDSLYLNNLSYSKDTVYYGAIYKNGIFQDSASSPLSPGLPSTSLGFPSMQVSGKDSLTFPDGSLPYPAIGFNYPLNPHGATYTIVGSVMTMNLEADTAASSIGESVKSTIRMSSHLILTLQKQ